MEFCAGGGSAEKIANRYGVSHSNLYCWQEKLFAGESRDEMQKPEEPITEGDGAITPILVRSARQPPISLPGTSMQKSPTKSG